MSRTNSNSITSILVAALNNTESEFRDEMLKFLSRKIYEGKDKKIDKKVEFYDCTHNPLLYKEMHGTEIDIIGRIPGHHKPELMIEIKASAREPLQNSQKRGPLHY